MAANEVPMVGGVPDFRKMTPEQVADYIEKRRAELQQVQVAAKAAGVVVKAEGKRPTDDKDKLEWLFERLGYQTGMRKWAQGRINELSGRIEEVLKVVDLSPDRVGKLLAEASEGYRTARIGTSFESTSMPDKKEAKNVPTSEVFEELMVQWRESLGPLPQFLLDLLSDQVEVEDKAPAEPSDRELFKVPAVPTSEPKEEVE